MYMGIECRHRGEWDTGRKHFQWAREASHRGADARTEVTVLLNRGRLERLAKDQSEAERCFEAAQALLSRPLGLHLPSWVALFWAELDIDRGGNALPSAERRLDEVLVNVEKLGDRYMAVLAHCARGRLEQALGRDPRPSLEQASRLAEGLSLAPACEAIKEIEALRSLVGDRPGA
jgi:hypothetical protein